MSKVGNSAFKNSTNPAVIDTKVFELTAADLAQLYGPSNTYLKQIGAIFQRLKLSPEDMNKVSGPQDALEEFEDKLEAIVAYVSKNKSLINEHLKS